MIDPDHGGQARISVDDYLVGPPELVVEITSSSVSIELHRKLHAYRRNAICEYVLWRVLDREVDWFVLRDGEYLRLGLDDNGRFCSFVFPGLWLEPSALARGDMARVLEVAREGFSSAQHARFVEELKGRTSRVG
jgi:Uma2 family endonuclease